MTVFVKRYPDNASYARAQANHAWLDSLGSGVRIPRLRAAHRRHLVFEHISGIAPNTDDLTKLAAALGRLHSAAATELATARLDRPHAVAEGHRIPDFLSPRPTIRGVAPICAILSQAAASIYKDSNLRNFIITDSGVAIVDFDDLTLAPCGYDLAKLLLSIAMTYGGVDQAAMIGALAAYNAGTATTACSLEELAIWTEVNWLLTADYLGRNGYRHAWPAVRPWPAPFAADRSRP